MLCVGAYRIWISPLPLRPRLFGCVITFIVGTLTKETVWTAPLIAIVLQRWQFGLTWREWWARDRGLVLAIATSAIPVIAYMTKHGGRSGTVAAGSSESFDYLVHQGWVIPRYLWTWICPTAACVDYGPFYPGTSSLAWLGAGVLSLLFTWSMIQSMKGRGIGVPLLCAFLYLAPSSSFIPVLTQVGGEQRFYLPGVVVVVYGVLGWSWVIERMRDQRLCKQFSLGVSVATGLLILIYISVSWQLNRSFATPKSFWNYVAAQAPHNLRARSNSARLAYQDLGIERAIEQWLVPLENQPSLYIPARLEAAELLLQTGEVDAAAKSLIAIIREDPTSIDAHVLYSRALIDSALFSEAIRVLAEVERHEPWRDDAWSEHGRCLRLIAASTAKPDQMESLPQIESEAEKLFLHALEINSANFEARFNLASLLLDQGRNAEALQEFRACLIYKANNPIVWHWLAQLYDHFGKAEESEYAAAESAYWQNR